MAIQAEHIHISIIIVNYKSWKHLRNCLESLQFQSKAFTFEIVVVDNQSNDGKLETFRQEFSHVHFVENSGNNGFANGCNVGAKNAQGDYLLFLNPDTLANQEAILRMWGFAKKNHTVGIVSCLQKKSNGGYEKSIRIFPSFFTLFGLTRAIYKAFNKNKFQSEDQILYTNWVSGSVVFISKEWLSQIGGWNEDYWMYYEDMDLCKRVHLSNGKVALLTSVEVIHNHGGASRINFETTSLTKTQVLISRHVYVQNHFKGLERFASQLLLVLNNLVIKLLLATLGIFLFFVPKMRLEQHIFAKIFRYYLQSLRRRTWLSNRSLNYIR